MKKNVFVIAGLMLASVFVGCQKERLEDITDGTYSIESVEATNCVACKGNDNFTIKINDEVVVATFDRGDISNGLDGLAVTRFYNVDTSFGATSFSVQLFFNGYEEEAVLETAFLHFYGDGGGTTGAGELLTIQTGGEDNVTVGDYTATYNGKGDITTNTFFDQTGEIDLKWTINVTPPSTANGGK